MSKERQRRRAERERQKAAAAVQRERREAKARRRRERAAAVRSRLPRRIRWARQQGVLARRRRRRTAVLVAAVLAIQIVVWFLTPQWYLRIGVLIVSVLALPVFTTLFFSDRK